MSNEFTVHTEVPQIPDEHMHILAQITKGDAEATKQLALILMKIKGLSDAAKQIIKTSNGCADIDIVFMSCVSMSHTNSDGVFTFTDTNRKTPKAAAEYAAYIAHKMAQAISTPPPPAQNETPRTTH